MNQLPLELEVGVVGKRQNPMKLIRLMLTNAPGHGYKKKQILHWKQHFFLIFKY
jgi:hypothetical protein